MLLFAIQLVTRTATAQNRANLFPRTTDNIHLEMVFNFDQQDLNQETGAVDLVWGSSYSTEPAGMYNSVYIPYAEDNYGYSISWYQQNHPDWLEYQCDKKTLAFEFGSTTIAPLDFANSDVLQFQ